MTDEVKSIVEKLRDYIQRYADPTSFANPIKGTAEILRDAIDMIEELSGKIEGCETQIAGLETMLNTAQSAAKTWQRRAEAAGVAHDVLAYINQLESLLEKRPKSPIATEPMRHGRWKSIAGFTACSECGSSPADWEPKSNNPMGLPPYCHSCGAKMDGGVDA